MRKILALLFITLICLSFTIPVFAHPTPPCADSGEAGNSDYALHHIISATANGNHVPGTHGGYSLCLDTGRTVHQPDIDNPQDAENTATDE